MTLLKKKTIQKPLKIAFIITGLRTGGAEMMLFKLLTRINREAFSPSVISLIDGGVFVQRIKALNIPVHFLKLQQGVPNPIAVIRLKKLMHEINPDMIQGWMYHANFISLFMNVFSNKKIPIIWSIHHSVDSLKNEKLNLIALIKLSAWFSKRVNKVVFSAHIGKLQHLSLGYSSDNALAIQDNFDFTLFSEPEDSQYNLRRTLGIPEDTILIGSLARYHPMKDHLNLINAAGEILQNYPKLHFVLAGPNIDINNLKLVSTIEQYEILDRVHLLGEIHFVPKFLKSLNIFVSTSAFGESFPNVIGEAMACGVPCITTDVGDSKIIVGNTGLIIPPQDTEALVLAFRKLLELRKPKLLFLGQQARNRILNHFDLDGPNSFVKKYEKIYKEVIFD